jgi:EAL domain-containing protein (putative c-di-GMP-specific phosphodiesterase class I)/ActR/RegA family two-component response regulator
VASSSTSALSKPRVAATVLVIDDDERVLRAISRVLVSLGHEVATALDGEAGLALVRDRLFDIAIVDRHMRGLDGLAVLARMRDIQPMCTRVLLTGAIDLDSTLQAVNDGAITLVLEKPVGYERLEAVVDESMRSRQRMFEAYQDLQRANGSAGRMRLLTLLASDDLGLALQPIIRADDHSLWGYEALLRSRDPVLNGPLQVLRAAEEHRLVDRLATAVATRAANVLDRLTGDCRLFVNLHPDELGDPEGISERLALLQRHAGRVIFEITERSSLVEAVGWERSLETILRQGYSIAVDDLGSGYSSLSVLAEIQPRVIKIDMSIVRDIDRVGRKQRLFELLCRFADATDALVVAEGIETEAEADMVKRCGAHLLQGYFFGRPEMADVVLSR